MKTIYILLIFVAATLTAGAQTKCKITRAYAFYTLTLPGMQMTDDNGNPIRAQATINRFIYMEWCGVANPDIDVVLYNNKLMKATVTAVPVRSVIPGDDISNNRDFKITAKKCNKLWKIELQPAAGDSMPEQDCRNIVIKIKGKQTSYSIKLLKETQLAGMPRY